ncbi:sigma-54-dependent Fis family transcriptional regulator [Pseudomonas sp. MTM4]|uniref:sigma-54 dependent transcriptional regulator n=1 Tax=unclassified Pseudomonas TaxID=196821 RepID=UPI0018D21F4F|nr:MULTISPECIES: sigma-54 dependent transcriptional regulator [unclassified Pseudomonas]MBC8648809.1 sigma-54-dependent Fis family transcriptional regulator [Pseudomonas sp. MT4]QXY92780.1 sigma-54-dependent Fis family transcriptional regulator [Pseudomonas sp. MTM4]
MSYSCEELFAPAPASARKKVIIFDNAAETGSDFLNAGLRKEGCAVFSYASLNDLDNAALKNTALVFVFIGGVEEQTLYTQVESLMRRGRNISVIPVVQYADQEKAATLLELGCVDYLLSPFSDSQLSALLRRQEYADAAQESFVTCSKAGRRLLAMAQRVSLTRAPILITGETGTGKELMARYIHRFSANADAPFIAVNCAAIPEQMLESILFGHEKGAFTGAVTAQPGKFELANGGTLLLDEIGELPLGLQAKLLRVLQEQRVERLGGRKEIELNVRIIAATNRDLQLEVAEGRFRSDLMFRLDVLPLHISPLRERKEDVLPLARRFVAKYAPQEAGEELFTSDACRALLQHDWPGNARELENTVQRALVLRNGLFIQPQDLGLAAQPQAEVRAERPPQPIVETGKAALRASGKWAEYQHVIDTIRRFDGHKSKAAASLGMTSRALRYRLNAMREQGIELNF